MEATKFKINVEVEVTEEMVKDLLTCGFEGGVGYWCQIKGYRYPHGITPADIEFPHIELPLLDDGGGVVCQDAQHEDAFPTTVLDFERIKYGLRLLMSGKDKYGNKLQPRHRANFLNENTDSETGDVFIQLCLLGEIVFG